MQTRKSREHELRQMWNTKQGQFQVLQLYWRALPGSTLKAGDCVFTAILDHECGESVGSSPQSQPHTIGGKAAG